MCCKNVIQTFDEIVMLSTEILSSTTWNKVLVKLIAGQQYQFEELYMKPGRCFPPDISSTLYT